MDLNYSVDVLRGVGPKKAEALRKAGIRTVRDFLYNLPRDYQSYQAAMSIAELKPGKVVVRGRISNLTMRRARNRNLTIIEGVVSDVTGSVRVVWFNQAFRMQQLIEGEEYFFTGNFEFNRGRYQLMAPQTAQVVDIDPLSAIIPIYVAHGAISSREFANLVRNSEGLFSKVPDLLPSVRPGVRRNALYRAHFPRDGRDVEKARAYLAYEELFSLILAARLNRQENEKLKAMAIPFEAERIRDFVGKLPFKLTDAQRRAAWRIFQDMEKDTPMNRLLQGDVGSGKTMVAAMAAYEATSGGGQVALLAPTAILATQHFENLSKVLGQFGVKVELLTGATKQKPELKARILNGEVDLVIGTHALLTDDTEFKNLALVIIDEQHRFGVEQRQKLMLKSPKGLAPHLLAMTATPIPRSLQLTVFGDLDVSVLNELPKGRMPVTTRIITEVETEEYLYPEIRQTVQRGQQVYWICKAIEEGGAAEMTSVRARAQRLERVFRGVRIAILHGKMKPDEKDEIMAAFSRGEIQILVSTTVVEVGVDVPNASLIVIENAEAYGLAQLHQLRGRVGRGTVASECFLLTSGDTTPSRRLRELERSNDGFHLAEVDLKLRGPGEIYGALQHGALDLRIATLSDVETIRRARQDVDEFLTTGMLYAYPELMGNIQRYQQLTTLN